MTEGGDSKAGKSRRREARGRPVKRRRPRLRNGASKSERRRVEGELLRYLDQNVLEPDFVAGVAGDRGLGGPKTDELRERMARRGNAFYSDLLFSLSHRYFHPQEAKKLWHEVMEHKLALSKQLGRNPGIAVAALDYLANVRGLVRDPAIIDSDKIATVAEVALHDGLTGLLDHSAFLTRLRRELRRHWRYRDRFALMMLDLDNFKQLNDERGHQFGDKVLAKVGRIITKTIRDTDSAGRYGGEEFAILVPRASRKRARVLAERIREKIEKGCSGEASVTASVGVACCPDDGRDLRSLIEKADGALYESKRNGKNMVTLAAETIDDAQEASG